MSNFFNEKNIIDFILIRKNENKDAEDIRTALHQHFDFLLDELLPLSYRILEGHRIALEINEENQK